MDTRTPHTKHLNPALPNTPAMNNDEIREALISLHALADKSQQSHWTSSALIWLNDLETGRFDAGRTYEICQKALERIAKEAPLEEALERLQGACSKSGSDAPPPGE